MNWGKKKKSVCIHATLSLSKHFFFSSFSFSPNSTWMYTVEITCWSIEKYFTFCDKSNIWYHIWLIRVLCWKFVVYVEVGEKAVVFLLEIRTVVSNGTFALAFFLEKQESKRWLALIGISPCIQSVKEFNFQVFREKLEYYLVSLLHIFYFC